MALWRTRTLGLDQKAQIAEEQQDRDEKPTLLEDIGSYLIVQDAKVDKVLSVELPMNVSNSLLVLKTTEFSLMKVYVSNIMTYRCISIHP